MWKSKRLLTMRRENRPKLTFTVHLASLSYISKTQYIVNSENHEIGYLIIFFFCFGNYNPVLILKNKVALLSHSLHFYCNCILRPFLPSDRSSKCKRGVVLMWRSRLKLWYYDFNIIEQLQSLMSGTSIAKYSRGCKLTHTVE